MPAEQNRAAELGIGDESKITADVVGQKRDRARAQACSPGLVRQSLHRLDRAVDLALFISQARAELGCAGRRNQPDQQQLRWSLAADQPDAAIDQRAGVIWIPESNEDAVDPRRGIA